MIGKTVSHYVILEKLGEGGMGIVYKAEDTKLNRTVAIKVLPSAALADEDVRARFNREARAAASLTHPHIAVIYEIDEAVAEGSNDDPRPFIAMEFIEGETLTEHIQKGPMKFEEAVRIAAQIADGLEAAHEKNIVHRDVKSANVMLTTKGEAKILDFGLAQTAHSTKLTRMGSTLGTVAYMSPEQARGEEVDLRTDLWALGAVLYEMISGRHPFPGDYEQAVLYSILNQDPEPLTALRTGVPMGLEWIVSKLLAKRRDERYQTATDLLVDLKTVDLKTTGMSRVRSVSSLGTTATAPVQPGPSALSVVHQLLQPLPMALAALTLVVGFAAAWLFRPMPDAEERQVRRFTMTLPGIRQAEDLDLSPDGSRMTFFGIDTLARSGLFEYDFGSGEVSYIPETKEYGQPHYSPDGRSLAFWSPLVDRIGIVRVPDGTPRLIATGTGARWLNDDTVLFLNEGRLYSMLETGSEPVLVMNPDTSRGHVGLSWFDRLPEDGLVTVTVMVESDEGLLRPSLAIGDLSTGTYRIIEDEACCARWVPSGHLQYFKTSDGNAWGGVVVVRPISLEALSFIGLSVDERPYALHWSLDVGSEGTFVFSPVVTDFTADWQARWLDPETGDATGIPASVGMSRGYFLLSRDGSKVAQSVAHADGSSDIVIRDLAAGTSLIVAGDSPYQQPVWSKDDRFVYFTRSEGPEILRVRADGGGTPERLVPDAEAPAVSPDGATVAFVRTPHGTHRHVFLVEMASGDVRALDTLTVAPSLLSFSPDGAYLAYRSNGPRQEIVVTAIDGSGRWGIPNSERWTSPKWSPSGDYLYMGELSIGSRLFRIPVRLGTRFETTGMPELIYRALNATRFDVHPVDGRLLISEPGFASTVAGSSGDAVLEVIQNWDVELTQKAPPSR